MRTAKERAQPAIAPGADVPALGAALVTVTLWGSAFVAIRDAGQALSPGSQAAGQPGRPRRRGRRLA
jgi:hypothetical protein